MPPWIKRVSQTWPAPTLDSLGRPVDWAMTSEVIQNWGRVQIIVGGKAVTFYRRVPVLIEGWESTEPFDDAAATLVFPQITPFEALPTWLGNHKQVDFNLIRPDGTTMRLFEGLVAGDEDSITQTEFGTRVEIMGAMYQMDDYLAKPALFPKNPRDIGAVIFGHFLEKNTPGLKMGNMVPINTGILTNKYGSWNPMLTGFIQELLSTATEADGDQWTVMKKAGRIPVLRLKDLTTVHWTVRVGQPGVEVTLGRDFTTAANVYYGEGIGVDNCRWRNAKYPNLRPGGDAPVFPGSLYYPGDGDSGFLEFERELHSQGYDFDMDGNYDSSEEDEVIRFQDDAGIVSDGIVGPQTWAAAFDPGSDGGSLQGGYFYPLAWVSAAQPFFTGAHGTIKEPNPNYDPTFPHVERYENHGADTSMKDGKKSAKGSLHRSWPPDYIGEITLKADPREGSRFEIKAGQNIRLLGHRGVNRLMHIAHADVAFDRGTVRLTVDEAGRDALTLSEIRQRNKENASPSWKRDRQYRNSHATEDRINTWDCEVGTGIIPRHATYQNLWNVLRLPLAAGGNIVRSEFFLDTPARFSVGVFDYEVTHNYMRSHGATPLTEGYWDTFGDGLIIAWGGKDQAAGYYPGSESEDDSLTGTHIDNASWYFHSKQSPWIWLAIWVQSPAVNYFHGRLFPGTFS